MHEVALSTAIAGIVERARAGRAVTGVGVDIGELRQVVPDTLTRCWDLVTRSTALAGARLESTSIPAVLECRDCGHRTRLEAPPVMVCAACAGVGTVVVSGEEFVVRWIEVKEERDGPVPSAR